MKYFDCLDCPQNSCLLRRNLDSSLLLHCLTGCYIYDCGVVEYRFDYNLSNVFEGGVCLCLEEEEEDHEG